MNDEENDDFTVENQNRKRQKRKKEKKSAYRTNVLPWHKMYSDIAANAVLMMSCSPSAVSKSYKCVIQKKQKTKLRDEQTSLNAVASSVFVLPRIPARLSELAINVILLFVPTSG
jgi:hypothetical protein